MAALPLGISGAAASPLNPEQTIIKPPDTLVWKTLPPFPPGSVDNCALAGETTAPGLYYTLVRWHPGFMSTPHYDGVIRGQKEPAVIAICGIGPVNFTLSDPSKPPWREV